MEKRGADSQESAEFFAEVSRAASWAHPRVWRGEVCPRPGPGQQDRFNLHMTPSEASLPPLL